MYKRMIVFVFLGFVLLFSQSSTSMEDFVSAQKQSPVLKHAQWALYAEYVDTGEQLLNINSDFSLVPASCLKLFTTAAALDILSPEFKFATKLYYSGEINKDGVLNGNLYIRGGGDPTLGSGRVHDALTLDKLMQSWVQEVKKAGIKTINGSVIADDHLFPGAHIPGNWLWIDLGNYYGAGVSALSIHDNLYRLYLEAGNKKGDPVRVLHTEPEITGLKFDNQLRTGPRGSGDQAYIYRAPGSYQAILRGTIPAGETAFSIKGSLPDPALSGARLFTSALRKSGIAVLKGAERLEQANFYEACTLFTTTLSPSLSEIVSVLNKRSVNLYAEQLLRIISIKEKGNGSLENSLQVLEEFLMRKKVTKAGLHLEDGSGLSPNNLITTKMMVQLLKVEATSPYFKTFYESLSLAGDDEDIGFFKNFGRNSLIEKKCRIKSGYIQGVRSHSGYIWTKSGRLIAFSFIANHFTAPYTQVDKIHEALLIRLAEAF